MGTKPFYRLAGVLLLPLVWLSGCCPHCQNAWKQRFNGRPIATHQLPHPNNPNYQQLNWQQRQMTQQNQNMPPDMQQQPMPPAGVPLQQESHKQVQSIHQGPEPILSHPLQPQPPLNHSNSNQDTNQNPNHTGSTTPQPEVTIPKLPTENDNPVQQMPTPHVSIEHPQLPNTPPVDVQPVQPPEVKQPEYQIPSEVKTPEDNKPSLLSPPNTPEQPMGPPALEPTPPETTPPANPEPPAPSLKLPEDDPVMLGPPPMPAP